MSRAQLPYCWCLSSSTCWSAACIALKTLWGGTAARALMISSTKGRPEPSMRTSKSSLPAQHGALDIRDKEKLGGRRGWEEYARNGA